ncbi:MAG: hypothetical protein AB8G05_17950 [Oligoflexales bacterium]
MKSVKILIVYFTVFFLVGSASVASEIEPTPEIVNFSEETLRGNEQKTCQKLIKNLNNCQEYAEIIMLNRFYIEFIERYVGTIALVGLASIPIMNTRPNNFHLALYSGFFLCDVALRYRNSSLKFEIIQLMDENDQLLKPASVRNLLGEHYEKGELINFDPQAPVEFYKTGTAENNLRATYNFARCHRDGIGSIEINIEEALKLFEKAGEMGEQEFQRLFLIEDSSNLKECMICQEKIWSPEDERYEHSCGRSFHSFCLRGWGLSKPCINCYKKIDY